MSNVSNTDIVREIGTLSERIDQNHRALLKELDTVKKKQDHTNGSVTELQLWRQETEIAAKAVADYQRKNPVIAKADVVNVENRQVWLSKGGQQLLIALAALITAVGTILAVRGVQ